MRRRILIEVIAALLIFLFLYASTSKWLAFGEFIGEMNNQPFPNWMTPYLVWTIPSLEVLTAGCLVFERTRLWGLWGAFALMTAFTVYTITVLLHFFQYIPCSCGGIIKNLSWKEHLVLNLFFLLLAVAGLLLRRRRLAG